jgi:hypothetical protein
MTAVKMVPAFKDKEAFNDFFKERSSVQMGFNQKLEALKKEQEEILKDRREQLLYSIPFLSDTHVRLSVDAMNNFYHQFKHLYSKENGILLKEIQIILCEFSSDLKLTSSVRIKFIFGQEEFNNHWAVFSLDKLYFDDKNFEFSDQSIGACLDPKFIDPEKYFLAKNFVIDAENVFKEIRKEKAEAEKKNN